jgi:ORF6N domain
MKPDATSAVVPRIFAIRGESVMLDSDLAILYGVTTGNFNKAVLRNVSRFPTEFSFVLTHKEFADLIFQIGTSKGRGGRRNQPWVFTEHGAIMAATILSSERAVAMSAYRAGACPERSRMGEDAAGVAGRCDAGSAVAEDREDAAQPRQRVAGCDSETAFAAAAAAAGPTEAADWLSSRGGQIMTTRSLPRMEEARTGGRHA